MGIEPTNHDSHRSSTGFEDQARHQTRSTSKLRNYITARVIRAFTKNIESLILRA